MDLDLHPDLMHFFFSWLILPEAWLAEGIDTKLIMLMYSGFLQQQLALYSGNHDKNVKIVLGCLTDFKHGNMFKNQLYMMF